jgi:hypothetical protein
MKKKLNDWLIKNNKTEIGAPFDKNGNYNINGKYNWTYRLRDEKDDGDIVPPVLSGDIYYPDYRDSGAENIIKGIIKHHNIVF